MGSLRHYFATQSELLCFAMQLVGDRARARIAALEPTADARHAAERLLHELVPLDDERRAEAEVWLAFTGQALVDPGSGPSTSASTTNSTAPAPRPSPCWSMRG
jgi:hypothetical protein